MRWKIISISYAVVAPVSDFSENCLQLDKGWQTPNHYHLAKKTVYLCHNWWQLCKRKTMHHQLVYCQQNVAHQQLCMGFWSYWNVLYERQKAIIPWVNDLSPLLTYYHLSYRILILPEYWYFLLEGRQLIIFWRFNIFDTSTYLWSFELLILSFGRTSTSTPFML